MDIIAGAKAAVIGAAEKATDADTLAKLSAVKGQGMQLASQAGQQGVQLAAKAGHHGIGLAAQAGHKVKTIGEEQGLRLKEAVKAWGKRLVQRKIETLVDRMPRMVKRLTDDPEMPRFVARGKDHFVDATWPDFRREILFEAALLLDGASDDAETAEAPACCMLAFFRYHFYPNDKSFWAKTRDPVFVIFTLIGLIPVNGICPLVYLFVFLIIDKRDEYQLVEFILSFKGTLFISGGVIRSTIGFFMFLNCVTAEAKIDGHACGEVGPGMQGGYFVVLIGYLLQTILVWAAWLGLRCSKEKGRRSLKGTLEDPHAKEGSQVQGGYLWHLLLYDVVVFALCVVILAYVLVLRQDFNVNFDDWVVRQALFAIQVVHGFLSMPFLLFLIPVLTKVLTHTVPTGYDRQGRCVRFVVPRPQPTGDDTSQDMSEPAKEDESDTKSLLDEIKDIFSVVLRKSTLDGEAAMCASEKAEGTAPAQSSA